MYIKPLTGIGVGLNVGDEPLNSDRFKDEVYEKTDTNTEFRCTYMNTLPLSYRIILEYNNV